MDVALEAGLQFGLKDFAKTGVNSGFNSQANECIGRLSSGSITKSQIKVYGHDLD
jgi:hypothetical protein